MYPALENESVHSNHEDDQFDVEDDQFYDDRYERYLTDMPQNEKSNKPNGGEQCHTILAKVVVCIAGTLTILTGLLVMAFTLYALFGEHDYRPQSEAFAAVMSKEFCGVTIWMIFSVGCLAALFSVVIIVAACCYSKPRFKLALMIFCILLSIVLLVELGTGAFALWSLGIITIPEEKVGNVVADQLLMRRNQVANATYVQCCVDSTPPYSGGNATLVDDMCKWPTDMQSVKDECGDVNVLVCVCANGPKQYAAFFGLFLRHHLTTIAVAFTVSAGILLVALVAACILICDKKKTNSYMCTDVKPKKRTKNKRERTEFSPREFNYETFFHNQEPV